MILQYWATKKTIFVAYCFKYENYGFYLFFLFVIVLNTFQIRYWIRSYEMNKNAFLVFANVIPKFIVSTAHENWPEMNPNLKNITRI